MSDSSSLVNDLGNVPIGGIPVIAPITIRSEVHSGVELVHMISNFFGGGLTAGQLHGELQPVCDGPGKGQLEHIRHVLNSTSGYTGRHLSTELTSILGDLNEAYQGAATAKMQTQFGKAQTLLSQMSPAFATLAGTIESTQTTLHTAWLVVKNYSRLHADESNVESLNPFSSSDSDDDKAQNAWKTASASLQSIGSHAAGTNPNGSYQNFDSTPYVPPNSTNPQANIANAGSMGPGPGNFSPGPGPGTFHPGNYHPGTFHPGQPGPGTPGPGTPGPGTYGPGPGYGPGGYGPGGYGPGGHGGPGGFGPGGPGGPGSGLDTGSQLASAGPGPGPGYGGPGPGSGGPGFGSDAGGAGGLGSAAGPGAGAGAAAGAAGAAGGPGAIPLGGRGGGGGGGGDGERDRSTWLTEDDDVWGDSDAPDGVIS